eukprot:GHVU01172919.1.p2 GENE.GHVU01172919.1~~GHVU01172919.1.p2  ORF type:complete len:108 (+),score=11.16 GHVU01172919.1:724-1047(+)
MYACMCACTHAHAITTPARRRVREDDTARRPPPAAHFQCTRADLTLFAPQQQHPHPPALIHGRAFPLPPFPLLLPHPSIHPPPRLSRSNADINPTEPASQPASQSVN